MSEEGPLRGGYEPELGQAAFGQPWHPEAMPDEWLPYLEVLAMEVQRVTGGESPILNSGTAFYCDAFALCSYRWDDEDIQPNFRHHASGLEVRWYKHAARGATTNDPDADFATVVLECVREVRDGCSYATDPTEHRLPPG